MKQKVPKKYIKENIVIEISWIMGLKKTAENLYRNKNIWNGTLIETKTLRYKAVTAGVMISAATTTAETKTTKQQEKRLSHRNNHKQQQ